MSFRNLLTNNKTIGRQYFLVGGLLLLLGYAQMLYMKWYVAPISDAYAKLGATHGTIMVFFGIVPMAFAGLGYYIMPISPSSRMYFPRFDLIGLALFYISAALMLMSLFASGMFVWILAMSLNIPFALICSVNFIATIVHVSNQGLRWTQMRSVVWALFVTACLLLFNFSLLEFAAGLQLANAFSDSNFWLSSPPPINSEPTAKLWQHAFWFLGHPEVYILLLLILGLIADGIRMFFRNSVNSV